MPENETKTHTISAEIFSAGEWTDSSGMKKTFTMENLNQIISNFQALKDRLKPPLKFGHSEKQIVQGQSDGDPALGWVSDVKIVGKKIVGTFSDVPTIVYEAIRTGRYKRVSSEIYHSVAINGKKTGMALRAVALLGADLPAVNNLKDLAAFLTQGDNDDLIIYSDSQVATFSAIDGALQLPITKEQKMGDDNQNQAGMTPEEKLELDNLRKFKVEAEVKDEQRLETERVQKFSTAQTDALAPFEAQVKAGKLTPAIFEKIKAYTGGQQSHFKVGDEIALPASMLASIISEFSDSLPGGEQAGDGTKEKSTDRADLRLAKAASAIKIEKKLSNYAEATELALLNDPELAKDYKEFVMEYAD